MYEVGSTRTARRRKLHLLYRCGCRLFDRSHLGRCCGFGDGAPGHVAGDDTANFLGSTVHDDLFEEKQEQRITKCSRLTIFQEQVS